MKIIQLILLFILSFPFSVVWAQKLTPGFDKEEYRELIYVATRPPAYFNSSDYVRTGTTIVLTGDDAYYKLFPNDSKDFFIHHSFPPYLHLLDRLSL